VTQYPIPTNGFPAAITAGPDGALWFTELYGNRIGRITTTGIVSEYLIPTPGSYPWGIAPGPDGALWFTENEAAKIGRITTSGVITEYPTPTPWPFAITAGQDGAMWFTEGETTTSINNAKVARITTSGVITEYAISAASGGITAGPDGALWFTEGNATIGRMTTTGVITEYQGCYPWYNNDCSPRMITAGPDGALWFTDYTQSAIGRITTSGAVTQYYTPTSYTWPFGIAAGSDGNMWFTESGVGQIGQVVLGSSPTKPVSHVLPLPLTESTANFLVQWSGIDPNSTITSYTIYVSDNRGPFSAWLTTSATQATYSGANGHTYGFYSIAKDLAGNVEAPKSAAEATTTVVIPPPNPVSHVSPLPASESIANFPVQWSGTDNGGPGIHTFTVYVSDNAGPFNPWLITTATQATYSGVLGHIYGFYSIATDWSGNQEPAKTGADATTYVAAAPGDLNGDGTVNCADINVVIASFGKSAGQPGYSPVADVNHDGIVNVKDLSWVSQYLVPGTQCPE
jgi:streptogramin lyase